TGSFFPFSSSFPTTGGALQTTAGGATDAFVTKFNAAGNGLVWSTLLGGSQDDVGYGIAVDSSGVYVTGSTSSSDFPTKSGSYQTTYQGGTGAFAVKLNPAGTTLVYGTFLGGSGADTAFGLALGNDGKLYLTGSTDSTNFPTVSGARQTANAGGTDAFVTGL